jgi:hypothetical protein
MNPTTRPFRSVRALPVMGLVIGLAACDGLLDVEQRGLITDEQLQRERLVQAVVAAAEGDYHVAFNWVAHSGASSTDEAIFSHVWTPWNDYDERDLAAQGCPHDQCGFGYDWMARARVTGVRSAGQLRAMGAPAAAVGRALEYAAYSTVMLADHLCQVVLNGGAPLEPAQAYDSAIVLFQDALQTAAGDVYLTNLANVGIARAYLNKHDLSRAIEYATKVDPAFEAWVRFVDSNIFDDWSNKYNLFHRTTWLEFNTALDPTEWTTKRDLRVPFQTDSTRPLFSPHPEPRRGYLPYTPYSFSTWTPGNTDSIAGGASTRFASGLEARYVIAEASLYGGTGGWTPAQVQSFIDERRAVGGHGAYGGPTTNDALAAELREQRKMDFYFAGYRMPDLIRYKKYYGIDLWPTGVIGGYPGTVTWTYGNVECWPLGQSEKNTNPNFP